MKIISSISITTIITIWWSSEILISEVEKKYSIWGKGTNQGYKNYCLL